MFRPIHQMIVVTSRLIQQMVIIVKKHLNVKDTNSEK